MVRRHPQMPGFISVLSGRSFVISTIADRATGIGVNQIHDCALALADNSSVWLSDKIPDQS